MISPEAAPLRDSIARCAGFVLTTILLASIARAWVPAEKVGPDFIQFWTAATLLSSGQDPYDPGLQGAVQRGLGWDKASDGLGVYDFLPYYYPPWLGLACVPLLPLGYPLAKLTWLVLNARLLPAASHLLRDTIEGNSRWVRYVLILAFGPSVLATLMGQISPLILFLIAAAWTLLNDGRRDPAAGAVLALATTKPQLTGLLVLGLLCRSARSGRWGVIRGFAATLAAACPICALVIPSWPLAMAKALGATPLPYVHFPGSGCSWLIVLKAVGLSGRLLAAGYALAAIPLALGFIRLAIDPRSRLDDLICASLIGPFFIVPYCRSYDLPVLLVPVLVLTGTRIREVAGCALLTALLTLPYFQHLASAGRRPRIEAAMLEYTYFWIPLMVLVAWWSSRSRPRNDEGPASGAIGRGGLR
jgi:hypothetical protein